nr:hypothetical protein KPHV_85710 [Kitasatospora purpeofusca]
MPTDLPSALLAHLRRASADLQGRLPDGIRRRGRGVLLEAGLAYTEDGDGHRLAPTDPRALFGGSLIITLAGRRAALTPPQLTALTVDVGDDGTLNGRTHWQTVHSLTALGLVETGNPTGELPRARRTTLGDTVAALPTP